MFGAIIVMLPKSGTLQLIVVNPGEWGGDGGHNIYPETPMDTPGFPGTPYICYIWLELRSQFLKEYSCQTGFKLAKWFDRRRSQKASPCRAHIFRQIKISRKIQPLRETAGNLLFPCHKMAETRNHKHNTCYEHITHVH